MALTSFRGSLLENGANTKEEKPGNDKVRFLLTSFKHRDSALPNANKHSFLFKPI